MSVALAVPLDMRKLAAREGEASETARADASALAAARDAALIERYRAGDRGAFDELVRRYQRPLYALALRYVRVEADAKDLAQRTFVKVFGALPSFRADSSFRTWIYRIAINLSLNHLRDRRREEVRAELDDAVAAPAPGSERRLLDLERGERLRDAIAELPPKQRLVLELRVYDELPFREVAELAGCSENAAKVNFHHAVKRLRALLRGTSP
jgi:RNA polymerase sigma-70 factor, ECF subfamily